ncbi:MAG TPA: hypothetical protein VKY22_19375 [Bradyrhizobium sp.]|nr:hypothetical protein [Bradyrhizobium sp.]
MPTRYSTEAYRPAPRWLTTWNTVYRELELRAVEILLESGFYDTNDIDVPDALIARELSQEESAAIGRIATALTIAADAAHQTAPGVVAAWLQEVVKNPALFRSRQLPPEVHWAITSSYRRADERPGMHLQDVWGRRRVRFEAKPYRATDRNIARSASLAVTSLRRPRGRPQKIANELLAEYLAKAFRDFGGRIVRRQVPIDLEGGGFQYVDGGPFYKFLEKVIGPLQEHLQQHGLPPVTIETIERIATERFAGTRDPRAHFHP